MGPSVDQPTILVLDDEKNIRKSIEIALEQEGMQVLGAHDVSSALRTLHERIVDTGDYSRRLIAGRFFSMRWRTLHWQEIPSNRLTRQTAALTG